MKNLLLFVLFTVGSELIFGQGSNIVRGKLEGKDTLAVVHLPPVYVFSKKTFKNKRQERKYSKLCWNVRKVYPYSKKAGEILRDIDKRLYEFEVRKDERRYLKQLEANLKAEFEKDLRNLTITQGKILVLLLDRETGHTCHHLIKDLKGGLIAFFWQNIGRLFGYNLKKGYSPVEEKEIESIVIALEHGSLSR